jgi:exopolysaccharide production protein ExoQ
MPPIVATVICLSAVAYLFWRDFRQKPNVTSALWLPFFWITISGTRFISEWLGIFGFNLGGASVEEGSPFDAIFFFVIIACGIYVLRRREVNMPEFMRNNRWITIYLLYCLLAIAWSDFPFVAFKRWIKLFGQPIMVLVVLTEPDPMESLTRLLKRFAYLVVPISILFIKYFPQWGRAFDTWTGVPMNTGITTNKNALGCDCFILGLFFVWHFQRVWRQKKGIARKNELLLCLFFFVTIGWLLIMAHSSTSLGALALAVTTMLFLGLKFIDRRRLGVYLAVIAVTCALAEFLFGIHNLVIEALGRNSTLTGRTDIWHILLNWDINPILGVGFESFWLGDRVDKFAELLPGLVLNEAHNGYLETYINMGLLGVFITLALLLATYFKAHRALLDNFDFGRFRLAYLAAFIVYNWTEAAFRTHCFPFFMFFLIAIDYPARRYLGELFSSSHELEPGREATTDVHKSDTWTNQPTEI